MTSLQLLLRFLHSDIGVRHASNGSLSQEQAFRHTLETNKMYFKCLLLLTLRAECVCTQRRKTTAGFLVPQNLMSPALRSNGSEEALWKLWSHAMRKEDWVSDSAESGASVIHIWAPLTNQTETYIVQLSVLVSGHKVVSCPTGIYILVLFWNFVTFTYRLKGVQVAMCRRLIQQ